MLRCGKGYKGTWDGSGSDWAVERALQTEMENGRQEVCCEVPRKQHRFQLGSWHFEWGAQGGLSKINLGVNSRVGDNGSHVSEWHIEGGVYREPGVGTKLGKLLDPGKGFQSCLCLGCWWGFCLCWVSRFPLLGSASYFLCSESHKVGCANCSFMFSPWEPTTSAGEDGWCHSISFAHLSFLF